MDAFVEVRGKSVEIAVEVAMKELGVTERSKIDVEVVQEPEKPVLGLFGGRDAIVRVSRKPSQPTKRRRRRRKKSSGGNRDDSAGADQTKSQSSAGGSQKRQPRSSGGASQQGGRNRNRPTGEGKDRSGSGRPPESGSKRGGERSSERSDSNREESEVSIDEQIPVVEDFLKGLVNAFGLEGGVEVGIDGDVIVANVTGSQTEAMVGPRGSVIESIHELTKTVLHRRTHSSARVRLDVAGYAERRRQALAIYAGQLLDQVMDEGGEVMLEPMSAADRKVIHDVVAERDGVRSYSEGEAPQRYVVISRTAPTESSNTEEE